LLTAVEELPAMLALPAKKDRSCGLYCADQAPGRQIQLGDIL